mmetsp:Transcript_77755/g.186552  ORF Transcript_77755/g.186552 Transcript_77755/m.186552 type:complete len:206 (+) Transcript_77755:93-710(+)
MEPLWQDSAHGALSVLSQSARALRRPAATIRRVPLASRFRRSCGSWQRSRRGALLGARRRGSASSRAQGHQATTRCPCLHHPCRKPTRSRTLAMRPGAPSSPRLRDFRLPPMRSCPGPVPTIPSRIRISVRAGGSRRQTMWVSAAAVPGLPAGRPTFRHRGPMRWRTRASGVATIPFDPRRHVGCRCRRRLQRASIQAVMTWREA